MRLSGLSCRLICTDANPHSAGLYRCDVGLLVPVCSSPNYVETLISVIEREGVNIVLIGSTPEVPVLAARASEIESRTGAKVVVSSSPVVERCFDKLLTCQWLASLGMGYPRFSPCSDVESVREFARAVGYPLIIKPRKGMGSRGVRVVGTDTEMLQALSATPEPVIQECVLPDTEEYTCGLFYDRSGAYRGCIVLRRELRAGETYRATVQSFEEIKAQLRPIALRLEAKGGINVQLRRNARGEIKIFEINPRFSSSTAIMAYYGFNGPEAALINFLYGQELDDLTHRNGIALRYTNEIYIEQTEYESLVSRGVLHSPSSRVATYF